jgi:hypothetical protein
MGRQSQKNIEQPGVQSNPLPLSPVLGQRESVYVNKNRARVRAYTGGWVFAGTVERESISFLFSSQTTFDMSKINFMSLDLYYDSSPLMS